MRFLIDNSLSPRFAECLGAAGHDAAHVRALGLTTATDETILAAAGREARVLVALDTDFGTILALRMAAQPSVVLFRTRAKSTERLVPLLLAHLSTIEPDLLAGAVVVFEDLRIRVRRLPIQ